MLNSLIADLYDAALDSAKLGALASNIATTLSAESCAIQVRDRSGVPVRFLTATRNYADAAIADYIARLFAHDERLNRLLAKDWGNPHLGDELLPSGENAPGEFRDWAKRVGIAHTLAAAVPVARGVVAIIELHRGETGEPFGSANKGQLVTLLPHLRRALQLSHRLSSSVRLTQLAFEGIDRHGTAALVVDREGRLLFANISAEGLLATADGIAAPEGRLAAGTPQASAQLLSLLAETISSSDDRRSVTISLPRRDRRPLSALICRLAPLPGDPWPASGALLFVRDPEELLAIDASHLRSLFGLTSAEAKLAAALASGQRLEDFAAAGKISRLTARTQLRDAMTKTRTNRQSELVSLILRTVVSLR